MKCYTSSNGDILEKVLSILDEFKGETNCIQANAKTTPQKTKSRCFVQLIYQRKCSIVNHLYQQNHLIFKSKCAGLIQFEERSSVESALQQSGKFEVGGQLIKIQRSHLPAVGMVPAGMHRVNPKGEGKSTKKNKFKKETKMKIDTNMHVDKDQHMKSSSGNGKKKSRIADESPSAISLSVLSFKPRGMRQKPKISLNDDSKKK